MRDLSGSNKLILTQETIAQMIGARRNSVSLVASTLQQANYIHYSRGHIEITNLEGLGKTSCECYAQVKAQYDRLVRPRRAGSSISVMPIEMVETRSAFGNSTVSIG